MRNKLINDYITKMLSSKKPCMAYTGLRFKIIKFLLKAVSKA